MKCLEILKKIPQKQILNASSSNPKQTVQVRMKIPNPND
jgi:hypothetical protein